jgi:hypothetical protein
MKLRIRGGQAILLVAQGASVVVDSEPGERASQDGDGRQAFLPVVLRSSLLKVNNDPNGNTPFRDVRTDLPGTWLDDAVRALGYEARRRRQRRKP